MLLLFLLREDLHCGGSRRTERRIERSRSFREGVARLVGGKGCQTGGKLCIDLI